MCGRCRHARYCGPSCQKSHWGTTHKAACKRLASMPPRTRPGITLPRVSPALAIRGRPSDAVVCSFLAMLKRQGPGTDVASTNPAELANPSGADAQLLLVSIVANGHLRSEFSVAVACDLLAAGVSPDAVSHETGDHALYVAAGHEGSAQLTALLLGRVRRQPQRHHQEQCGAPDSGLHEL